MPSRYNPITETIDHTGCKNNEVISGNTLPFAPNTTFIAGKIKDIEDGYDNIIDACSLPITKERQTIDLGTLDELCN